MRTRRKLAKASTGSRHGVEPAREDVGVLERLAGALPGIRQHRVRRVADELDAAAAPVLRERPREQAPFRALGDEAEQLLQPRLGVGKAQPHLVGIAAGRPAFLDPFVGVFLGDDVHELLCRGCNRREDGSRARPIGYGPVGSSTSAGTSLPFEQRAPDHLAGIGRIVVAVERLADDRAHAVGADHDLGLDLARRWRRRARRGRCAPRCR